MLSRVKTKKGLFMRKPLSRDLSKYAVPTALQRMLECIRNTLHPIGVKSNTMNYLVTIESLLPLLKTHVLHYLKPS
jgi:hypothetical protein